MVGPWLGRRLWPGALNVDVDRYLLLYGGRHEIHMNLRDDPDIRFEIVMEDVRIDIGEHLEQVLCEKTC